MFDNYLQELSHCSPLLLGYCCVSLLDNAKARYGQLKVDFQSCLGVFVSLDGSLELDIAYDETCLWRHDDEIDRRPKQ